MNFQAWLVRVFDGMALVEVELVVAADAQRLAQRAVGGEFNLVEPVGQAKFARLQGPRVQDGLGGGRDQKGFGSVP